MVFPPESANLRHPPSNSHKPPAPPFFPPLSDEYSTCSVHGPGLRTTRGRLGGVRRRPPCHLITLSPYRSLQRPRCHLPLCPCHPGYVRIIKCAKGGVHTLAHLAHFPFPQPQRPFYPELCQSPGTLGGLAPLGVPAVAFPCALPAKSLRPPHTILRLLILLTFQPANRARRCEGFPARHSRGGFGRCRTAHDGAEVRRNYDRAMTGPARCALRVRRVLRGESGGPALRRQPQRADATAACSTPTPVRPPMLRGHSPATMSRSRVAERC